jgi:two-component system sensor histidine kinase and response regulator WspE
MAEDLSGFSMLELFRLEADTQTAILSSGVLAIERLDLSPGTIEAMMRAAHSLKGAARIVGVEPAVTVAHALEDCFVAAGRGDVEVRPEHTDILLECIDFLGTIGNAPDGLDPASGWPIRAAALVAALTRIPAHPGPAVARVRAMTAATEATARATEIRDEAKVYFLETVREWPETMTPTQLDDLMLDIPYTRKGKKRRKRRDSLIRRLRTLGLIAYVPADNTWRNLCSLPRA